MQELEALFDALPDVVFFVKDGSGRYAHANLTLVARLGLRRREQVVGRSVEELFPAALARSFAAQDRRVLRGERITDHLELHLFPNRSPGWCLTCKRPLAERGRVSGLIGISRDLGPPDGRHPTYDRLRRVVAHLKEHYASPVRMQSVAALAEVSVSQLERHCSCSPSFASTPPCANSPARRAWRASPPPAASPIKARSRAASRRPSA